MKIRTVGVLGSGLMGSGIAQISAQSGFPTTLLEVSPELLDRGLKRIEGFLRGGVEKGKVTPEAMRETLSRLRGTTRMEDLEGSDLIVEAITEDLQAKRKAFSRLDEICPPTSIFASNTSSLSITEMMTATR